MTIDAVSGPASSSVLDAQPRGSQGTRRVETLGPAPRGSGAVSDARDPLNPTDTIEVRATEVAGNTAPVTAASDLQGQGSSLNQARNERSKATQPTGVVRGAPPGTPGASGAPAETATPLGHGDSGSSGSSTRAAGQLIDVLG